MLPELRYYAFLTLIILIGVLIISSPHFPNSSVSQENNNSAFLALTIIGTLIVLPALIWMGKIFKVTTFRDITDKFRSYRKLF